MRGCNLAWILNDRLQSLTEKKRERLGRLCPDFVIEILSPFMKLAELQQKMDLWIANGAQVAWLVNIKRKTVTVYRADRQAQVVEQAGVVRGDGVVAGFEVNMAETWISAG